MARRLAASPRKGCDRTMEHCCDHKTEALAVLRERQKGVLQLVLAINAAMFVAEGTAGLLAHSTALLADALDMLGDAFVYGLSLYALHRSARWRTGAALTKGIIMAVFGVGVVIEAVLKMAAGVVIEAVLKMAAGVVPVGSLMGLFGLVALAANGGCLALLMRHRSDDLNMRSTWVCSQRCDRERGRAAGGCRCGHHRDGGARCSDRVADRRFLPVFCLWRYSGVSDRIEHGRSHDDLSPCGTSSRPALVLAEGAAPRAYLWSLLRQRHRLYPTRHAQPGDGSK